MQKFDRVGLTMTNINEAELLIGISDALEVEPSSITISTVSTEVEEWDSLGHIAIMSYLDKSFEEITERVPEFASATSVKEIFDLLSQYL